MRTALIAGLLLGAACKRAPPPPPPAPARYCDQNLTGVWVNASDPTFAYRLEDRGNDVQGKFFRREADGSAAAAPDDEPMTIELRRTTDALAGVMKTVGESPSGRKCPVEFALRVSSCQPQAVQVVAEMSLGVRDDCTRAKEADGGEPKPELVEFRWDKIGDSSPN